MKLTETMERGLMLMSINLKRSKTTMAEPNENTAKALERRGLIECVGPERNGWNHYRLTEAGRKILEDAK